MVKYSIKKIGGLKMEYYNRPQMKQEVKQSIKGKWLSIFLCLLIYSALSSAGSFLFGIGTLLASPMLIGIYLISSDVLKGENVDFNKLFMGYKDLNRAFNFILLVFVSGIFIVLWSLLFFIPGIIAAYRYSQAMFIFIENPELSFMEAIEESKKMMVGHKWELFVFDLSFIGHILLVIITFGIYSIYYTPLFYTSRVRYFQYLNPTKVE